jgi:hypothetical protein
MDAAGIRSWQSPFFAGRHSVHSCTHIPVPAIPDLFYLEFCLDFVFEEMCTCSTSENIFIVYIHVVIHDSHHFTCHFHSHTSSFLLILYTNTTNSEQAKKKQEEEIAYQRFMNMLGTSKFTHKTSYSTNVRTTNGRRTYMSKKMGNNQSFKDRLHTAQAKKNAGY